MPVLAPILAPILAWRILIRLAPWLGIMPRALGVMPQVLGIGGCHYEAAGPRFFSRILFGGSLG